MNSDDRKLIYGNYFCSRIKKGGIKAFLGRVTSFSCTANYSLMSRVEVQRLILFVNAFFSHFRSFVQSSILF